MPLNSVRVLDLTRLLPGPYCTMILADFGAEVIKVEDPKVGDYARHREPKLNDDSAFFHSLNRNKKSITLDLKSEEGKQHFLELIDKTDIVVESFRPGVMERLGIGYETLKERNPGIIYCAITGYGQTGPYTNMPGHDINYISYAGLLNLMGERNGKPVVPAAQIADIGGGALPATVGILLALIEKGKTGKGQFVDISMMDNVVSWLQAFLPGYLASNVHPKRGEERLNGGLACYEVYQTKDNRWLSVGALEMKFWEPFCKAIEKNELITKLNAPIEEQEEMKKEIQSVIWQKTQKEWMDIFSKIESCVASVLDFEELENNHQIKAREMIQNVKYESIGEVKQIGIPIKLSETPGEIHRQAPGHGEHTNEILNEMSASRR